MEQFKKTGDGVQGGKEIICPIGVDNQRRITHLEKWEESQNHKLERLDKKLDDKLDELLEELRTDNKPSWAVTIVVAALSTTTVGLIVGLVTSYIQNGG